MMTESVSKNTGGKKKKKKAEEEKKEDDTAFAVAQTLIYSTRSRRDCERRLIKRSDPE